MPAGIQVMDSELEGPVFADANGKTLYSWPLTKLRNGDIGDRKDSGISSCTDEVQKVTSGLHESVSGRAGVAQSGDAQELHASLAAVDRAGRCKAHRLGPQRVDHHQARRRQVAVGLRRLSRVHLRSG